MCVLSLKFLRLLTCFELPEFYGTYNWSQDYASTDSVLEAIGCITSGGHDPANRLCTDPDFVQNRGSVELAVTSFA